MQCLNLDEFYVADDGDTYELDDTHRLVLHVEPDYHTSVFDDTDCYGKLAWVERNRDTGQPKARPEGFNGSAIKLSTYDNSVWWQPWDGYHQLPLDEQRDARSRIRDLIEYGYKCAGVELQQLIEDERGGDHWVTVAVDWLGGIDEMYAEAVSDLVAQVMDGAL